MNVCHFYYLWSVQCISLSTFTMIHFQYVFSMNVMLHFQCISALFTKVSTLCLWMSEWLNFDQCFSNSPKISWMFLLTQRQQIWQSNFLLNFVIYVKLLIETTISQNYITLQKKSDAFILNISVEMMTRSDKCLHFVCLHFQTALNSQYATDHSLLFISSNLPVNFMIYNGVLTFCKQRISPDACIFLRLNTTTCCKNKNSKA